MASDVFGFDRDSAKKIARVVREHLGSPGGSPTHRRTDVSGPGNHVAQAVISEMGGSVHKFRFVAGEYVESIATATATYDHLPDEYYAYDICRTPLQLGDYVWIVDHNSQWWIIDRCSGHGGTGDPKREGCCGMCGQGGVTTCDACTDEGMNAMNTYAFVIPAADYDDACCEQGTGSQFVHYDAAGAGCIWTGMELDQCEDPSPQWVMTIDGINPYDVELKLDLPGIESVNGTSDSEVIYTNPWRFCCNCANEMRLKCGSDLPIECQDWPCIICLLPGPKCCDTTNIAQKLTATITGNGCPCGDGVTVDLEYVNVNQIWEGNAAFCDRTIFMRLQCGVDGGGCTDFTLEIWWDDGCFSPELAVNPDPCACNPFSLAFQNISSDGCCNIASTGATIDVVITL